LRERDKFGRRHVRSVRPGGARTARELVLNSETLYERFKKYRIWEPDSPIRSLCVLVRPIPPCYQRDGQLSFTSPYWAWFPNHIQIEPQGLVLKNANGPRRHGIRPGDGQIDFQFGFDRNGLYDAEATAQLEAQSDPVGGGGHAPHTPQT